MNYFFIIICSIILSPFSASQIIPKLCVGCKFYTKDFFTNSKYGKCALFPIEKDKDYFLVNGNNNKNDIEYTYCSISRKYENMCGKEGKFYKQK